MVPSGIRTIRLAVLSSALVVGLPSDADACGSFRARSASSTPSPERERVLVVFDPVARIEHLVREVTFRAASEPFAFVVPVPARPEVADVAVSPFARLEAEHPLSPPRLGGALAGASASRRAVADALVVEHKEVAGFDVTVLDARDGAAVTTWLESHGFAVGADGERWAARYARPGFHVVALRFAAPTKPGQLVSRVLRLGFNTALPFYPYREPLDTPDRAGRELDVWVVSPWAHAAVSTWLPPGDEGASARSLARPWSERVRHRDADVAWLGQAIGARVPARAVVTTFVDRNVTREGWDDVVLVPSAGDLCADACAEAAAPLASLADSSLDRASASPAPPPGAAPRPWSVDVAPAPPKGPAPPGAARAGRWPLDAGAQGMLIASFVAGAACIAALVLARRLRSARGWALCGVLGVLSAALAPLALSREAKRRAREEAIARAQEEERARLEARVAEDLRKLDALLGGPLARLTAPASLDVSGLALDMPAPTLPAERDARRAAWGALLAGHTAVGALPEIAPGVEPSSPNFAWLEALGQRCAPGQPRVGVLDVVIEAASPPRASWASGPFSSDFLACSARFIDASLRASEVGSRTPLSLRMGVAARDWPVAPALAGISWSLVAASTEGRSAPSSLPLRRALRSRLASAEACRPEASAVTVRAETVTIALELGASARVRSATGPGEAWSRAASCVATRLADTPWPEAPRGRWDLRVTLESLPPRPSRPPPSCAPGDPLCGL